MSNPEQTVSIDVMIRRLEEANARAHERVRQQNAAPPAVPDRRSWQSSYFYVVMLIVTRWVRLIATRAQR
jgi:hypothetical protein